MKKLLSALLAFSIPLPWLAVCGPGPARSTIAGRKVTESKLQREVAPTIPAADLNALVDGNTAFALELYQLVIAEDGNLCFSPYSISVALAMTFAGARTETETQMAEALHFTLDQDRLHPAFNSLDQILASRGEGASGRDGQGFRLHVVNALWGEQTYAFLPDFLDTLARNYGAGLRLVDYVNAPEDARLTINAWVSDQTEGRIQDLIARGILDSLTRLVLTNAIYFNAAWALPFEESQTADGAFHRLDGSQVTVPLMRQVESFGYAVGDGYQAIELPYDGRRKPPTGGKSPSGGRALSMVVLLPDEGAFEVLESGLDDAALGGILAGITSEQVALALPRFEFESQFSLAEALKELGMPAAFSMADADLSGMDGSRELYISQVLHKTFVAVDEAGTEAAAATAVITKLRGLPVAPIEVTVDRPFLFLIRDVETGTILFLGRVLDPAV